DTTLRRRVHPRLRVPKCAWSCDLPPTEADGGGPARRMWYTRRMAAPQAPATPGPTSPRPVPRWLLAALALGHAGVFAWAATVLPWQRWPAFAAMTAGLALAHAVTAVFALLGSRHRAGAWRVSSALSLLYLAIQTVTAARAGSYVAALYGGLGEG